MSENFTQASRELCSRMASGWDTRRNYLWETSKPVGEWLVEKLDVQPGQTVLELAAGLGDSGFLAARLLGERGRLISTDLGRRWSKVRDAARGSSDCGTRNFAFSTHRTWISETRASTA